MHIRIQIDVFARIFYNVLYVNVYIEAKAGKWKPYKNVYKPIQNLFTNDNDTTGKPYENIKEKSNATFERNCDGE